MEEEVGQAGTASNIKEDEGASSGVRVRILSANPLQASHVHAEDPCTGEAAIIMDTDTKKDGHTAVEIHYNKRAMSLRLVEGGLARVAGQSCLAGPSVLRLHPSFGHRRAWEYGREPRPESQAFLCTATHFLEHHGLKALWWPCSHPHFS